MMSNRNKELNDIYRPLESSWTK